MKVIITGGCGFLGQQVAKKIMVEQKGVLRGQAVTSITLVDVYAAPLVAGLAGDPRVHVVETDISAPGVWDTLVDEPGMSVFHLAAIMSGQGESEFDLCMNVNLRGFMSLIEQCRKVGADGGKLVHLTFTSTGAVFGPLPLVTDETKPSPMTTYGTTKAMCELLVNDYSRKGFIDGRGARLPTVVVRPGKPNGASTGCYSGIVREALDGVDQVLPVADNLQHAVGSTRTIVGGIVGLHNVATDVIVSNLGQDRVVNIPSFSVTLRELGDALHRVVKQDNIPVKLGHIDYSKPDERLNRIVSSMMSGTDSTRAIAIGLPDNPPVDECVRQYVADFWSPPAASKL